MQKIPPGWEILCHSIPPQIHYVPKFDIIYSPISQGKFQSCSSLVCIFPQPDDLLVFLISCKGQADGGEYSMVIRAAHAVKLVALHTVIWHISQYQFKKATMLVDREVSVKAPTSRCWFKFPTITAFWLVDSHYIIKVVCQAEKWDIFPPLWPVHGTQKHGSSVLHYDTEEHHLHIIGGHLWEACTPAVCSSDTWPCLFPDPHCGHT